jgi:oligopeptide transport system substrate-binding protein
MLAVYFFRFNVERPPFDDPDVRRAFSASINRRALASCTLHGVEPANSFVPPMPGYESTAEVDYAPQHARSLLADKELGSGLADRSLRLVYNTDENHRLVAESVQAGWKRELGVAVTLDNREWRIYLSAMDEGDYEIARSGWIGDYTDPMTFLKLWTTDHPNNDTGWGNARYDQLIERARLESDRSTRMQLMAEAEKILLREAPVAPVYFYGQHHLVAKDIQGWEMNPRDIHLIRRYSRAGAGQ